MGSLVSGEGTVSQKRKINTKAEWRHSGGMRAKVGIDMPYFGELSFRTKPNKKRKISTSRERGNQLALAMLTHTHNKNRNPERKKRGSRTKRRGSPPTKKVGGKGFKRTKLSPGNQRIKNYGPEIFNVHKKQPRGGRLPLAGMRTTRGGKAEVE